MNIGPLNTNDKVIIVAEIGNNHEGSAELAHKLIDAAAEAGVDAVKFQTFQTRLFVAPHEKARFERLKSFELPYAVFEELAEHAREKGLFFFSTPLDLESASFLATLTPVLKIASSDNTFLPLLRRAAESVQSIIVSGGLASYGELVQARDCIQTSWKKRGVQGELAFLHCVTAYPTPPEEVHLHVLPELKKKLELEIGYSDHCLGMNVCLAAVALGARIIEKHFTVDNAYSDFRDHALSLNPSDMKKLVESVREIEQALGGKEKTMRASEAGLEAAVRRGAYAARDIQAGADITESDVLWLRPSNEFQSDKEQELLGRQVRGDLVAGEAFCRETVK